MNLQNKMTLTWFGIFALCVVSMETKSSLELDDVTVAVNEPFKYQIGDKMFLSQYRIHRIVDKNTKTLPEWLTFDNATNILYGTPGMGDIGTHPIRLKATCIDFLKMECQEKISRTFFIRIVEPIKSADSRGRSNYHLHAWNGKHHGKYSLNITNHMMTIQQSLELTPASNTHMQITDTIYVTKTNSLENAFSSLHYMHENSNNFKVNSVIVSPCIPDSPSFYASLILHVQHELSNTILTSIVSSLSSFVSKPFHLISLSSSAADLLSMPSDNKYIITAGPGNVVGSLKESLELSWHLGCDEFNHVSELARVLQHNVEGGRLPRELGYDIIAWYIYSDRPVSRRTKRNAHQPHKATRTPTYSLEPSSSVIKVSSSSISLTYQPPTPAFSSSTSLEPSSSFVNIVNESLLTNTMINTITVPFTGSILPTPVSSTKMGLSMTTMPIFNSSVLSSTSFIPSEIQESSLVPSSDPLSSLSSSSPFTATVQRKSSILTPSSFSSFFLPQSSIYITSLNVPMFSHSSIERPSVSTSLLLSQIVEMSLVSTSLTFPSTVEDLSLISKSLTLSSTSSISKPSMLLSTIAYGISISKPSMLLSTVEDLSSISKSLTLSSTVEDLSSISKPLTLSSTGADGSLIPKSSMLLSTLTGGSAISKPFTLSSTLADGSAISKPLTLLSTFADGSSISKPFTLSSIITDMSSVSKPTVSLMSVADMSSVATYLTFSSSVSTPLKSSPVAESSSVSTPSTLSFDTLSETASVSSDTLSNLMSLLETKPSQVSLESFSITKELDLPLISSHFSSQSLFSSQPYSSSIDLLGSIGSTTYVLSDKPSFTSTPAVTDHLGSSSISSFSFIPNSFISVDFTSLTFDDFTSLIIASSLTQHLSTTFEVSSLLSSVTTSFKQSDLEKETSIVSTSSQVLFTSSDLLSRNFINSHTFFSQSPNSYKTISQAPTTSSSTFSDVSSPFISSEMSFSAFSSYQVEQSFAQTIPSDFQSTVYTSFIEVSFTTFSSQFRPSISSILDVPMSSSQLVISSFSYSESLVDFVSSISSDIVRPLTSSVLSTMMDTSTAIAMTTEVIVIATSYSVATTETSTLEGLPTMTMTEITLLMPSLDISSKTSITRVLSTMDIEMSKPPSIISMSDVSSTSGTLTFSNQEVTSSSKMLTTSSIGVPPTASPDEAPILQNSIDHLPIVFGKLFTYRIPANAFNDTEDGNTRNLILSISLLYGKPIPLGAWLKFNSTSQTLYGIPLQQDFKDNADLFVERFVLIASDSQNQLARDVISLTYSFEVLDITHRISLTLDYGFENFHFERQNLVDVAELIANFYGNPSLKYLTFFDVMKGSVIVRWGNNSLFGTICYKDVIVNLFTRMGNESGSLTTEFAELLSMYNPVSIQLELSGPCLQPQHTPLPPFDSPVGASDSDKMWIEILLPALIVILVLVIIALVLLICCRHKKPSKEPKSDKPMFLEDRRPIIFPEELEMVDPSLKPKQPLILPRDYLTETPPAVPPHGLHELPSYHVPEINEDLFRPINSETPPPPSFNSQATTSEPPPYRLPPPYFNPHRSNINT